MSKQQYNSSLMIYFNTRSLAKNKNLIEEFITEIKYSPEVIGMSETKINSKTCPNLNIPGFVFFHNDSPTNAGGVAVYINQNLKNKLRKYLTYQIAKIYRQKFQPKQYNFCSNLQTSMY